MTSVGIYTSLDRTTYRQQDWPMMILLREFDVGVVYRKVHTKEKTELLVRVIEEFAKKFE